ncbi:MAG: ABC transporter permease [Bryobacteraceae bacterium]|nr:ABC transporter permease [Bryobacteraceae bacterium]MDW8377604.1 ABC transporter permease [Bryobacterales bacterium]
MSTFLQDIRFSARILARSPGFTLVAIFSLALGIGANTAIFTLTSAAFVPPMLIRDLPSLVSLYTVDEKTPGLFLNAYPNLEDYRRQQTVFSDIVDMTPILVGVTASNGSPVQQYGELVPGRFFEFVGVSAAFGRTLLPEDDGPPGSRPVVVLSHGFWQSHFGGDPSLVGRTIRINREPYTVVGVMPKGFRGLNTISEPALWAPTCMYTRLLPNPEMVNERRALYFYAFARLKPGIKIEQAQASLEPITRHLAHTYPINQARSLRLMPTAEASVNPALQSILRKATTVMMSIVSFVLLIACANVASLLVVRARRRSKEFAIRLALGAQPRDITRQMLIESTLLSLGGGLVGLLVARWIRDAIWSLRPPTLANISLDLSLNPKVLGFTLLVSVLTGLLFGLAPALHAWRRDLASDLKERTSESARDRGVWNLRGVLVASQCALSAIALICAGLFLESLRRIEARDPGFEIARLALLRLNFGAENYRKDQIFNFLKQAVEQIEALPAVRAATFSSVHPLSSSAFLRGMYKEGDDFASRPPMVSMNAVAPRFFETTAVRLLEGREFTFADREGSPPVVVVNHALARSLWPGESAVGKRIKFTGDREYRQVIGVAADSLFLNLNESPRPLVFIPLLQELSAVQLTLLVRTAADPSGVFSAIRKELQSIDPNLALPPIVVMREQVVRSLWPQRFLATMLSAFGFLGLILAAIGVYGLTSYSVTQRVSEIGIRMALGATSSKVMGLIIRQSFRLIVPGLALGLLLAFVLARFADSLLSGVTTSHPPAYIGSALVLLLVALVACWIPSRRATQIQPLLALRQN